MKEYNVVTASDIATLQLNVDARMNNGWTCQGGIYTCQELVYSYIGGFPPRFNSTPTPKSMAYLQAMIKEGKP